MKKIIKISALALSTVCVFGVIVYFVIFAIFGSSPFSNESSGRKEAEMMITGEDGANYYFTLNGDDYSFKKVEKTVTPNGYSKIVDNRAQLTVERRINDWLVKVTFDRYGLNENIYTVKYSFRSGITFTEESLEREYFYGDENTDYKIITRSFAASEELRELVSNGIKMCLKLNEEEI